MPERPIEIVCFDLGGVLVRICDGFGQACARVGLDVRGDVLPFTARTGDIDRRHATGALTEQDWALECARALDGAYAPEELLRVYDAWLLGEYAGAFDVVLRIQKAGVRTACLSNTTEGHWRRLVHRDGAERLAGPPEFPTVFHLEHHYASHRLGLRKPDEAIYRAFEAATGHRGAQILFFDDLRPNVEAARRLGWRAEAIDPSGSTAAELTRRLEEHGVF
jgi:glucose-1-phosphatase